MTQRALVIALVIAGSLVGTTGAALADQPGVDTNNNHNVCVVYSSDQKYNNTSYYCVSTGNVPPPL